MLKYLKNKNMKNKKQYTHHVTFDLLTRAALLLDQVLQGQLPCMG